MIGEDSCAWPTLSPDGRWLACFRSPGQGEGPSELSASVLEVDGLEERELMRLDEGAPLYARFSPDGRAVALLTQREDQLELWVGRTDQVGGCSLLDEGPPLFFSWMPDNSRLVLHAGGPSGGRLVIRDALGSAEDVALPGSPGTFCAPMALGDRVVVAFSQGAGASVLCAMDADGAEPVHLVELAGLVAFLPSPDGSSIVYGQASADRGPYQGLFQVAVAGGQPPVKVVDDDCVAFFWLPDGSGLIWASGDAERRCLWWKRQRFGQPEIEVLCAFRPTRAMMFHLHFFEQFAQSHPLVSGDGRWLIYATWPGAPDGPWSGRESARIEVLDLHQAEARPQPLVSGDYATFAPQAGG